MKIAGFYDESISNGLGWRAVLFVSGCPHHCPGCHNSKAQDFNYGQDFQKEEIINRICENSILKGVTLSGGDPLTRKDIYEIIEGCNNLNLVVHLDTVGIPFITSKKIIGKQEIIDKFKDYEILKHISMIGIPLDGSNNEIISKFRISDENLFENQIKILNLFEKLGINLCINTVFHKENKEDIKNIYTILKQYQCVKKWQIFEFMPIGLLGFQNKKNFEITIEEFNYIQKEIMNNDNIPFEIEWKSCQQLSSNYMLVNASGLAYKVDSKIL